MNCIPEHVAALNANKFDRSGHSVLGLSAETTPHSRSKNAQATFKVALKELNETGVWLRMVCRAELLATDRLAAMSDKNQHLCHPQPYCHRFHQDSEKEMESSTNDPPLKSMTNND